MPHWIQLLAEMNPEHYVVLALRSTLLKDQGINVFGTDLIIFLLFALGMILQRYERGDYAITEKGFRIYRTISDLYAGFAGNR